MQPLRVIFLFFIAVMMPLDLLGQQAELSVPGHNLFVNEIHMAHARFPDMRGEGISISFKEFDFDSADVDFKGRYLSSGISSGILTTHASIVATIAAGAGNGTVSGTGVASGAWVSSAFFNNLYPDEKVDYDALGTSIQNHSYGGDIENMYGLNAVAFDESVWQSPALLHVFSAGNSGTLAASNGIYAGMEHTANLTGNFKMAKNALVVGATDSFLQIQPFSAVGPAFDGRIKPDLVAYGQDGTSGAAALVSGAAALLQQLYRKKTGQLPPAALTRALLINAAGDIGVPGPDFQTGFGSMNLCQSMQLLEQQQYMTGEVQSGGMSSFSLVFPTAIAKAQFTLCWDEPPASVGAERALLNDLDLRLIAPDGSIHYPLSPSSFPHPDSLLLPATAKEDHINTTERITMINAASGEYQVEIRGNNFKNGAVQAFSIVWKLDTAAAFQWVSPVMGAPFFPEKTFVLRWNGSLPGEGSIDWYNAATSAWQSIDTAVNLSLRWHKWTVPDFTGWSQIRMKSGGYEWLSDTILLARPVQLKTGFYCEDSTYLFWNSAGENMRYQLWGLGASQLEPLFMQQDTQWVFSNASYPQKRFAVSSSLLGITGARSDAPDPSQQGAGCIVSGFLAQPDDGLYAVNLSLTLGTTYGVKDIFFEKWQADAFQIISNQLVSGKHYASEDISPDNGINRYRAGAMMIDGRVRYAEPVEVHLNRSNKALLFPMPAPAGSNMEILLRNNFSGAVLTIMNASGQLVQKITFEDNYFQFSAPGIPGIYFYNISGEEIDLSGKLIVIQAKI